jgi:SPP1 gp7 family putative phage head morphogenesis protein
MSAASDFAQVYRLSPEEALRYLEERNSLRVTFDWRDLWQEEHAHHFTVSRLAALDVLENLRRGIIDSVAGDLSRRDFMRDLSEYMAHKGWWGERTVIDVVTGDAVTTVFDPARLKLIYDTNTRQAYAAGQWERIERNRATHPYIRYITQRDSKVRDEHAQWDNITLPVEHPFWDTHLPLNGFNCRCRVVAVSRRDYERGQTPTGNPMVKTAPPERLREWTNTRTGETLQVPVGIQPGFAYNVGKARAAELGKLVDKKLTETTPGMASAVRAAGLTPPKGIDELIAAGQAISATLPDGGADALACHAALLERLAREVGTAKAAQVATRGAGAALVKKASERLPDSWTEATDRLGPLHVKAQARARAWHYTMDEVTGNTHIRLSSFGVVPARKGAGYILVRTDALEDAVHEYAHRIQAALPALDALFQELHRRRTAGEQLMRLRDLTGIAGYRRDEWARRDKYINPYQGKEYTGRGALEVMSMALESVLGVDPSIKHTLTRFNKLYNEDRKMFDFVIGLLFHWKP